MITWQELKVGNKVIYEGVPYEILDCQHLKVAQGKGLSKVIMKNLITGVQLSNQTFREVDKFDEADISTSSYDYLYNDGTSYNFMNTSSYEQVVLTEAQVWDAKYFLSDGDKVMLQEWNGVPINVKIEASVNLKVVDTPPGERGNTATWGKKPATLHTGLEIQVPLFVNIGDMVRVDTREHTYLGRA